MLPKPARHRAQGGGHRCLSRPCVPSYGVPRTIRNYVRNVRNNQNRKQSIPTHEILPTSRSIKDDHRACFFFHARFLSLCVLFITWYFFPADRRNSTGTIRRKSSRLTSLLRRPRLRTYFFSWRCSMPLGAVSFAGEFAPHVYNVFIFGLPILEPVAVHGCGYKSTQESR